MLGQFTSDLLEKEFGKLLKRSGETYLITAQQVLKKITVTNAFTDELSY